MAYAWDGKGKLLFKDGRYYDGNFVQNRADGFGTMTFPDDYPEFKEYSGNWKNNAWDGKGKLLFKDGRYYDGSFVQNRAEGYGTITYPDDHPDFVEYSGNWKNNAWDGEGALKYKNGNFYQGQFAVNYPNGLGSYTFSNDDKDSRKSYIGQFVHDYFEGDGVIFYRGGMIEIGNYRNDLLVNGYLILLKWNRYCSVKVIDSIPGKKERIKDIKSYIENIIRDSPIKEQLLCAIKESGIFDSF
ncbi:MAG TPA: hypothetical protein PLH83_09620 [Ruminococcus sp.]|nr:hypothetical protein [Ruminococcus sp.]